ncbi:MAG: DUF1640 domain-containing protein [Pseudomonadota bacterium]
MTRLGFDTLRYSQRLKATGMSEQQAVAQAEAMAEALGDLAEALVTKEFFHAVLDKELGELRSTLRLHSWILGVLVVTNLIPLLKGAG